jgi:uncharacterized protein YabE (DUF348 family)
MASVFSKTWPARYLSLMASLRTSFGQHRLLVLAASLSAIVMVSIVSMWQGPVQAVQVEADEHLLTVYDRGIERGVLTRASTIRESFQQAGISIDPHDNVEPGLDEKLIASTYEVNIYRARPVTIIDGQKRVKIMSPYRTPKQILDQAGIVLHDADSTAMKDGLDINDQSIGVHLIVTRATQFTLMLYGKKMAAYSQAGTVAEMLKEKNITLSADDTLSAPLDAPLDAGMTVTIWRNGIQTVTEEQPIPFDTQRILDIDRKIGHHEIKTKGELGTRLVSYEIEAKNGKEIGRKQIQSVVSQAPITQVELVGNQPVNPLTKSKGAQYFVDSKGVRHRETYYDLPMNVTMNRCGGGTYTVRVDGAKIDQDGYILIAANLGRYPACSVVETSMGLGKVYDTGGFAAVHPDGFDLATDWTKYDGV